MLPGFSGTHHFESCISGHPTAVLQSPILHCVLSFANLQLCAETKIEGRRCCPPQRAFNSCYPFHCGLIFARSVCGIHQNVCYLCVYPPTSSSVERAGPNHEQRANEQRTASDDRRPPVADLFRPSTERELATSPGNEQLAPSSEIGRRSRRY